MRIIGEWLMCDDGVARPTVHVYVQDREGQAHGDDFLVDTGADRTVLSSNLWRRLGAHGEPPPVGFTLQGVGGGVVFRTVNTALVLTTDDGRGVSIRGEFAAFIESQATELSILGRDVLDNFDVIHQPSPR